MRETRRAIGVGAFIVVALGTAWALEHQADRRTQAGATDHVIAPATATPREDPGAGRITAPEWQPQYDRSDLQLIQG
jgi:hypothetical protein